MAAIATALQVRFPPELYDPIRAKAVEEYRSINSVVLELVRRALEQQRPASVQASA